MKAILKKPGQQPELINMDEKQEDLFELVGRSWSSAPALFGAMVICRSADAGLEYNCHFLGRHFYGNILVVGRDKGDKPCDLPDHLHRILRMALKEVKQ